MPLAALKRENSRGAHYREDFPDEGDLATSTFTVARQQRRDLDIADEPVEFTIVRPARACSKEGGGVIACQLPRLIGIGGMSHG